MDQNKAETLAKILAAELSNDEIRLRLQQTVDQLDEAGSPLLHYVIDVYEEYFIYEARCQEGQPTIFYRQSFATDEDGQVTLEGDPVEVVKETIWREL